MILTPDIDSSATAVSVRVPSAAAGRMEVKIEGLAAREIKFVLHVPPDYPLEPPAAVASVPLHESAGEAIASATGHLTVTIDHRYEQSSAGKIDTPAPEIRDFVESVYRLDARDPQDSVDLIVDRLDDLQNDSKFDDVESLLLWLDPLRLSAPSIVSVLGITLAAKSVLDARRTFYSRARRAITIQRGGRDAADKLLSKYR